MGKPVWKGHQTMLVSDYKTKPEVSKYLLFFFFFCKWQVLKQFLFFWANFDAILEHFNFLAEIIINVSQFQELNSQYSG